MLASNLQKFQIQQAYLSSTLLLRKTNKHPQSLIFNEDSMVKIYIKVFIFVSLLYCVIGNAQKGISLSFGSPFITNYNTDIFTETGRNWGTAQSMDGRMYFANDYGLILFDGYNWERIGQPNNRSELRSFLIHKDKIFIGGTSEIGYFSRDNKGNHQYYSLNDLIKNPDFSFSDVHHIICQEEKVFFLTDYGILEYNNEAIRILGKGISFRTATKGIEALIFSSSAKGLFKYEGGNIVQIASKEVLQNINIEFLLAVQPGTYLIGSERKGVFLFDGKSLKTWNDGNQAQFIRDHLTCGLILNKKQLIFGTLHQGIVVTDYEGNIENIIDEEDGLLDHNIRSLYKDYSDNIWAVIDGGVAQIELNSPFTIINKKYGLRGEVHCILEQENLLYVGTSRGLYVSEWQAGYSEKIQFQLIPKTEGHCWQLFEHQGQVLLAHHNGIYLVKKNTVTFLGGNGNWNFVPLPGKEHLLLSGNYTGITRLEKVGNSYQIKGQLEGFSEPSRRFSIQDGYIWVPHGYKGIYRLKLSEDLDEFIEVKLYDKNHGFPSNLYNTFLEVEDGLIFGTQNGAFQYNPELDTIEPNLLFNQILGTETLIRKIFTSPQGNYFSIKNYAQTDEVALIELLEDGSFSIQETPFQKLRGLLIPAFESISFTNDQNIFIGSKQGLIIYNANFGEIVSKKHKSYINKVFLPVQDSLIFKGSPSSTSKIESPISLKENESIEFEFSSTFLESIPYTSYASYLEGYDQGWQEWSLSNHRKVPQLPNGQYTLWVKSKNIYDIEGKTTSLSFQIKNQAKNTLLYKLGIPFIIISLITYYLFFKGKTHRSTNIENLEKQVEKQRKLIQQYEKEKVNTQQEIEAINKELSNSLLKNEIYTGLVQKTQKIIHENQETPSLKKALVELQNDFEGLNLQISTHQKLETDDFLTRIKSKFPDLTPRELRLCSYLKLNVSSKEIAQYLGISVRGVESLRYRVRKKLELSKGQDLVEFIMKL